jgi:hypothetical protein
MTNMNGDPEIDALGEEELAQYFEERRDDDSIWQKKGRRLKPGKASTVFQMRIAPDELEEITRAAGGNVSEFVRSAALEKARRLATGEQPPDATSTASLQALCDAIMVLTDRYTRAGRPFGDRAEGISRWIESWQRLSIPTYDGKIIGPRRMYGRKTRTTPTSSNRRQRTRRR